MKIHVKTAELMLFKLYTALLRQFYVLRLLPCNDGLIQQR